MNKYKVIAICGKSAAGKDTFLHHFIENIGDEVNEIISHTTRPPREGEIDGKNYYFIDDEEFLKKIWYNKMLETAKYKDWWYGTALDALDPDRINVGVFNRKGLDSLLKHPDVEHYVVFITANSKIRLLRSLNREENPDVDEIVRRYMADEEEWKDFNEMNYTLINDG